MKKTAGLLLIILAVMVLVNMPAFKGLSVIHLDRPSDLFVGEDPGGALGIIDLDLGLNKAILIGSRAVSNNRELGTIANNFNFPIQLNVTVVIKAVIVHAGNPAPRWRNVRILFARKNINGQTVNVETLSFNDFRPGDPEQLRRTSTLILNPGEALVIFLDRDSTLHQIQTLSSFQAETLFSVRGSSTWAGNISFSIEPKDDLRKRYIAWNGM